MNKLIMSLIALVVLFVVGGLLLQGKRPIPEEPNTASKSLSLSTDPSPSPTTAPTSTPQPNVESATIDAMEEVTELKIEDITEGTGDEAVAGKLITVNYEGTLLDGTVFDSSYPRGEPFSFPLGAGRVIEGWDKGFAGMKVGGKRKLTIPANMAYGERAAGKIPANSPLIFVVELLKVE